MLVDDGETNADAEAAADEPASRRAVLTERFLPAVAGFISLTGG
jgi:hypothetical protein